MPGILRRLVGPSAEAGAPPARRTPHEVQQLAALLPDVITTVERFGPTRDAEGVKTPGLPRTLPSPHEVRRLADRSLRASPTRWNESTRELARRAYGGALWDAQGLLQIKEIAESVVKDKRPLSPNELDALARLQVAEPLTYPYESFAREDTPAAARRAEIGIRYGSADVGGRDEPARARAFLERDPSMKPEYLDAKRDQVLVALARLQAYRLVGELVELADGLSDGDAQKIATSAERVQQIVVGCIGPEAVTDLAHRGTGLAAEPSTLPGLAGPPPTPEFQELVGPAVVASLGQDNSTIRL